MNSAREKKKKGHQKKYFQNIFRPGKKPEHFSPQKNKKKKKKKKKTEPRTF
jgi:hypothetical protein